MNETAFKKIYIIAGEASGDLHGANLIQKLREISGNSLEVYGVGGDRMKEAGVKDFYDLAHFHVTGLTDALLKIPQYKHAAREILSSIEKARPGLVVLIDNPGFNLHLAKKIHAMNIPIVYFIAPQVWAWAPKRVFKIKKFVKKVLVVFQFEKKFFEDHGVPVVWVGNPLKDLVEAKAGAFKKRELSRDQKFRICLLPGSRSGEIKTLFPIFVETAKLLHQKFPDALFSVVKSKTLPRAAYDSHLKGLPFSVSVIEEDSYGAVKNSDLAIACSGTVTLECALLGTPMLVANKGSFLTYLAARCVILVKYLGLPNLILGKEVFKEFLQYDATPRKIADEVARILSNGKTWKSMHEACEEVSQSIGETGATLRAASEILALL